jgi:hypothetical protein
MRGLHTSVVQYITKAAVFYLKIVLLFLYEETMEKQNRLAAHMEDLVENRISYLTVLNFALPFTLQTSLLSRSIILRKELMSTYHPTAMKWQDVTKCESNGVLFHQVSVAPLPKNHATTPTYGILTLLKISFLLQDKVTGTIIILYVYIYIYIWIYTFLERKWKNEKLWRVVTSFRWI